MSDDKQAVEIIANAKGLGRKLWLSRLRSGLKLPEIEQILGISGVREMELGQLLPTPHHLVLMCIEYGVDLSYLIVEQPYERIKWYGDFQDDTG
jgi:transcriptional regulator with XRE-family HTH domain